MKEATDERNDIFGTNWAYKISPFWNLGHVQGEVGKESDGAPKPSSSNVTKPDTRQSRRPLSSFKRTWNRWADETTLHGIKFVFDDGSSIVRRLFWILLFGSLLYYLVATCVVQTQRYLEYNTVTKTTMKLQRRLTLPALTICNYNLITNDSVKDPRTRQLLQEYYAEDTNMDVIENLGDEFLETVSLRDLLIKGSPQVQRTFSLCWVFLDITSCFKLLRRKKTENGYCFIFGSKEHNKTIQTQLTGVEGGVSFLLWLDQDNYFIGDGFSAGVKIIIHEPDEEPDYRLALSFSPGHLYSISLRKEEANYLPYPVKAFGDSECVETKSENFKNPLEYYSVYSPYACMVECRSKFVQKQCHCTPTYGVGNYSECTPLQLINCVQDANLIITSLVMRFHECGFELQECLYQHSHQLSLIRAFIVGMNKAWTNQEGEQEGNFTWNYDFGACYCPLPCHVTTYKPTVSSSYLPNTNYDRVFGRGNVIDHDYTRANLLQIQVYYESLMVKQEDQILEFTSEDLIASFGGFLGLAIGASVITILEILERLVISLYRCFRGK